MTTATVEAANRPSPEASVVIPAYNAGETLAVQLAALAQQTGAPPFEVIVADNGSSDRTVELARSFVDRLDVRVLDASERRGPAHARNAGIAVARTANILFCDADDRVDPGWVAALVECLRTEAVVTGPVLYVDSLGSEDEMPRAPRSVPTGPRIYLDQVPFAPSCNLAMRASVLAELGGFDPGLRTGQDADLTIRAQVAGHRLAWAQDAVVYHGRRGTLAQAVVQFYRYGYHNALIFRKLRGRGLEQRSVKAQLRPYVALVATSYRLFTRRRRAWILAAAQKAGRLSGSIRFGVWCP